MVAATTNLPGLDAEVVLRQVGPAEYVVKHVLQAQLDGQRSRREVRDGYRE